MTQQAKGGSDKVEECKSHKPKLSKMGYLAAHAEADRRLAKGQKQQQCPICKLWFFKDEFGSGYKSDIGGELIPTVIVEFDEYPDLWMTKDSYDDMGKMKGLIKSGFPLRNIIKVHHVLKTAAKYPTNDWP